MSMSQHIFKSQVNSEVQPGTVVEVDEPKAEEALPENSETIAEKVFSRIIGNLLNSL